MALANHIVLQSFSLSLVIFAVIIAAGMVPERGDAQAGECSRGDRWPDRPLHAPIVHRGRLPGHADDDCRRSPIRRRSAHADASDNGHAGSSA